MKNCNCCENNSKIELKLNRIANKLSQVGNDNSKLSIKYSNGILSLKEGNKTISQISFSAQVEDLTFSNELPFVI